MGARAEVASGLRFGRWPDRIFVPIPPCMLLLIQPRQSLSCINMSSFTSISHNSTNATNSSQTRLQATNSSVIYTANQPRQSFSPNSRFSSTSNIPTSISDNSHLQKKTMSSNQGRETYDKKPSAGERPEVKDKSTQTTTGYVTPPRGSGHDKSGSLTPHWGGKPGNQGGGQGSGGGQASGGK